MPDRKKKAPKPPTTAQLLRAARAKMGLSQLDLAAKSGVVQSVVSKLENEPSQVDRYIERVRAVAGMYGVAVEELFAGPTRKRRAA
jgi:transcriptional regulator with XRE-family HTH domain